MPVVARITLICAPIIIWFMVLHKPAFLSRPGERAFRKADKEILINHGTIAFGNSTEAQAMALEYSKNWKIISASFFTNSDSYAVSLTDGDFLTYCHLDPNNCVFLVHVPQLGKLEPDAKKSIEDLAWMNAQAILRTNSAHPPTNLGVGIKGVLSYDSIMIGNYVSEPTHSPGGDGLKIRSRFQGYLLYPFFASEDSTNVPLQNNP
jgi:hypothetical protein